MKKFLSIFLTASLALTTLTACGSKSSNNANDSSGNKQVTLRFSWWGDDSRHKATLEAIKQFETKYPNIKIQAEYAGWDGYQDKQTTQMAGGTAADIMQINWNWLPIFSNDGNGFYDLNSLSKELGLEENYSKDILETGTVKGKLNAIPVALTGRVFYFNKTTYDKNGVELPKTWDDLMNAGQKFKDGSYPIIIGSYDSWLLAMTYAEQVTGKQFISNDGKLVFTQDDIKTGLQFYKELLDKKAATPIQVITAEGGKGTATIAQLPSFLSGKFAGIFEWTSAVSKCASPLKEKNMEMVFGGLPILEGAKNSGAIVKPSMMFAINKNCKYPKEAATFLNYILNDPEGVKLMGTNRGIPVSKIALETLKAEGKVSGLEYEGLKYLETYPGVPISPYLEDAKLQSVYCQTIEQLSYNKLSIDDAAKYMYDNVQKVLSQIVK
ncbi:ABC transporter substrate-binding protein [Clostridium prolinivorans]|uniref:ABC transporter substrate-binding protein n=1 Tax=Clostridium prolinivorans TaxID=2769420 RepID=UPI000FD7CF82|nr:ABC transporter substrate-binding protein [Clostridium prolinivorans]